jgi:hypothetical protein
VVKFKNFKSRSTSPKPAALNQSWVSNSYGFLSNNIWYYLPIPLFIMFTFFDWLFLSGILGQYFPDKTKDIAYFSYIFIYPHIIMSSILFFDKDCIKQFKMPLALIVLLSFFYLLGSKMFFAEKTREFIFVTVTTLHVFSQQYGIFKLFVLDKSKTYYLTKWSNIICAILLINLTASIEEKAPYFDVKLIIGFTFLLISGGLTAIMSNKTKNNSGRMILWGNYFLVISLLLPSVGTTKNFFSVILLRSVHDLTAIYIYFKFSESRNRKTSNNIFSISKRVTRLNPAHGVLAAAFFFSWILQEFGLFFILELLVWIHYGTESIAWKKNTIFRSHLRSSFR